MIESEIKVRVRYAETDKMGYVYYGNYATYFEVARVETFRNLGFSYKELEDAGTMMPVLEYKTKYIKPAFYDDLLTIKSVVKKQPTARIVFEYEVYNEAQVLLTVGETTLVFVNVHTGRPCLLPESFEKIMNPYFDDKSQ
ncbi:MAG TPA: thioesterase family protein [Cytophagaceae bacterium]|jgi:acyl-CoA thioester hydrolase